MHMFIVMVMNIYITKENESFLRKYNQGLDGKPVWTMSGLINKLLDDYKTTLREGVTKTARVGNAVYVANGVDPVRKIGTYKGTSVTTIIPDTTPVKQLEQKDTPETREYGRAVEKGREKMGLCRIHGTPLDDRGRCLQKGCKYA